MRQKNGSSKGLKHRKMDKEGSNVPASASEDGELVRASTGDESQERSSDGITASSSPGETMHRDDGGFIEQNTITNELDDRISNFIAKLDEMGPTVSRYQYEEASSEVQRLESEMKERAMASMVHHLRMEDAKTSPRSQKGGSISLATKQKNKESWPTFLEIEIKLKELEKQSNKVARRIKEHKREQAQTMEKIQILEARALLDEKKDFIKAILSRVPTETDLQNLETIRLMMIERRRAENRIQLLNMRTSALDKAMGAVAKSKWFRDNQARPSGIAQFGESREIGVSSREVNSGFGSHEIQCPINDINGGSDLLKKKPLPDFTLMSASKRDAFLAKNFPQQNSPDLHSPNHSFLGMNKAGIKHQDGSGKSTDNSEVTIVTLDSNDTNVDNSEGKEAPEMPGRGEIQEGSGMTLSRTRGPNDSTEDSDRNNDHNVVE